jgi:hypothetical protein
MNVIQTPRQQQYACSNLWIINILKYDVTIFMLLLWHYLLSFLIFPSVRDRTQDSSTLGFAFLMYWKVARLMKETLYPLRNSGVKYQEDKCFSCYNNHLFIIFLQWTCGVCVHTHMSMHVHSLTCIQTQTSVSFLETWARKGQKKKKTGCE